MQTDKPTLHPPAEGPLPESSSAAPAPGRPRFFLFWIFAAVVGLAFILPLIDYARFSVDKDRNTYLLMVPFIAAYLIRTKRKEISFESAPSLAAALVPAAIGAGALAATFLGSPDAVTRLSLQILALLGFLLAGAFALLGASILRQLLFPVGFLIFAIPVPPAFAEAIEIFLQYTSAEAAYWMLALTQMPMLRNGLDFHLPGISIKVAQECSGYDSSFVLFMVSTLAGYLFLKSPWKRATLALAVIPLAIIRNGFRVTTISLLCVHVSPNMIDSFIHHHGGPIFFALSLIPFLVLLWLLRRSETRGSQKQKQ